MSVLRRISGHFYHRQLCRFLRRLPRQPRWRRESISETASICSLQSTLQTTVRTTVFTVDLRNPDKEKLDNDEKILAVYLKDLAKEDDVKISTERLTEFDPVPFDEGIVEKVEKAAKAHGLSVRRITSGAGQDAQMIARICPTAMIFVPSVKGISHNPEEYTKDEDVLAGAGVFLDVVMDMAVVGVPAARNN